MKVDKISVQVYLGMLGIPFFCIFVAGAAITGDTKFIIMGGGLFVLAFASMMLNNRAGDPAYRDAKDVYQFPPPKRDAGARVTPQDAHAAEEERKRLATLKWRRQYEDSQE